MSLAIIESGGANFASIAMALARLNVDYVLTSDKKVIQAAEVVLLPGVGSAGFAMHHLKKYGLIECITNLTVPVLGICLGMQLLYQASAEDNVKCLGIIPGEIKRFAASCDLVVPHMGWNNLEFNQSDKSSLLSGIEMHDDVYFVHSYYAPLNQASIASCHYGVSFTAITKQRNFYGMQFHPEKSGIVGEKLLLNFFEMVKNGNPSSN